MMIIWWVKLESLDTDLEKVSFFINDYACGFQDKSVKREKSIKQKITFFFFV